MCWSPSPHVYVQKGWSCEVWVGSQLYKQVMALGDKKWTWDSHGWVTPG